MRRQIWKWTIRTLIVLFHMSEPYPYPFQQTSLHRNTTKTSLPPPHPLGTLIKRSSWCKSYCVLIRSFSVPCLRKDVILGSKNSEEKWVLCRAGLGMAYWLRVFVVRGAVMPTNIVRVYICLTVVCRSLSGVRVMLLFYVHGKHLWSCRDGQLTYQHFFWACLNLLRG